MNFGVLILCAIIGIIFGIIGGALWMVIKVMLAQRKALKDYKNKNIMEIKNSPNEKIEEEPKVPESEDKEEVKDKSISNKLFEKKK